MVGPALQGILRIQPELKQIRWWWVVFTAAILIAIQCFSFDAVIDGLNALVVPDERSEYALGPSVERTPDIYITGLFVVSWLLSAGSVALANRPRKWARYLALVPAFVLVTMLVLESCLLYGSWVEASGQFEPALGERMSFAGTLGRFVLIVSAFALLVLLLGTLARVVRGKGLRTVAILSLVATAMGWLVLNVRFATHVGMSALGATESQPLFGIGLLLFLWALGLVAVLPPLHRSRTPRPGKLVLNSDSKGGSSVSSARSLSLVIFALVGLGWSAAIKYNSQAELLSEVRGTFGANRLITALLGEGDSCVLAPVGVDAEGSSKHRKCSWRLPRLGDASIEIASLPTPGFKFRARNWSVVRYAPSDSPATRTCANLDSDWCWLTKQGGVDESACYRDLSNIAFRAGIEPPSSAKENSERMFEFLDQSLTNQIIAVPNTGLSFRASAAAWVVMVLLLALLVTMRSQLKLALHSGDSGRGEPWVVLDENSGLERILATLWSLGILMSPWIIGQALLITLTSTSVADGVGSSAVATVRWSAALGLTLIAGWVSLTILLQIVELRRARHD